MNMEKDSQTEQDKIRAIYNEAYAAGKMGLPGDGLDNPFQDKTHHTEYSLWAGGYAKGIEEFINEFIRPLMT